MTCDGGSTRCGYGTRLGECLAGDSRDLMRGIEDGAVNLVVTSPPFALVRGKGYEGEGQEGYVERLLPFCEEARRILADDGSLVLDVGGSYLKGRPVRSLHSYRLLLRLCDEGGFRLAEDLFWHNPAKMPGPAEWACVRKIRTKDAVDTVWWLSKTDFPKADAAKAKTPYSKSQRRRIDDARDGHRKTQRHPSGHKSGPGLARDRGGALPSNLLQYPNSASNSEYLRYCRELGLAPHPARFPAALPRFFVEMLTDAGDLVVDMFSGSNVTGRVCEDAGRRWASFESSREYVATSALRFAETAEEAGRMHDEIAAGGYVRIQEEGR